MAVVTASLINCTSIAARCTIPVSSGRETKNLTKIHCFQRLRLTSLSSSRNGIQSLLPVFLPRNLKARVTMSTDVEDDANIVEGAPAPLLSRENAALAEKFAVLDTGKWECQSCGYVYDQSKGDSDYPISAGTEFKGLPDDWRCPTCGAAKTTFSSKSKEIAGFSQNQSYGLGGNSLTSNQKSLLIYGSLVFFFALFLSGYFLQ
eukprot:jgi/Mesen1/4277/ME000022S03567